MAGCSAAATWTVAALCLLLPGPSPAEPPTRLTDFGAPTIVLPLEPIHSRELFEGQAEISSGTLVVGSGNRASSQSPFASARLATTVVRRLPDLWQLHLAPDSRLQDLQVSYELVSSQGARDRLSHAQRPDLEVRTRVWPLAPRLLERGAEQSLDSALPAQGPSSGNRGNPARGDTIVQGGVVLEMEVESVRAAGTYEGTLTVTLHQL